MPRGRTATQTAPTPSADPLADLRPPEDDTPAGHTPETPDPVTEVRPTAPEAFHDAARSEVVAAFHADSVAQGMLHKGGTCGCRYLATLALRTVLGAPQEPVEVVEDPEDPEDG